MTIQHRALNLLSLTGLILLLSVSGCEVFEEPASQGEEVSGARSALLIGLATEVYYPTYVRAYESLNDLEEAVSAWDGERGSEALLTAREAWETSTLRWQRAELMQVGPAGQSGARVGGEDRRDLIYSYPLNSPCRVDQELLAGRYEEEGWALGATINAKGLDALERLLFASSDENLCPEASAMNRDGEWASWTSEQGALSAARKGLALVIIADLKRHMSALVSAWGEGGPARVALSEGSAPFSGRKEALDEVYASLFYLDQVMKDLKLALPLGLSMDCAEAPCLAELELNIAQLSREALVENLEGLLWVWCGGDPARRELHSGFDDLLIDEGAPELAEELLSKTEALIQALGDRQEDLMTLIEQEPEWVEARHTELRALTDLMKSQLVTVLNLSVPLEGAGDND